MRMTMGGILSALGVALILSGCAADYRWRSDLPAEVRTVAVPVFRNSTDIAELGVIASRQLLREFQREGTFTVKAPGDAVLEIQGALLKASSAVTGYDRKTGMRHAGYGMTVEAQISVIDKRAGRVLVDNRRYQAHVDFAAGQDIATARRDASGRLAEDLARQVVDDLLMLKW